MLNGRLRSLVLALPLLAACAPGATPPASVPSIVATTPPASTTARPASTVAPSADLAHPVGMIAIGHSGLTGEGTSAPGVANKQASWATGTDPEVNSIYARLVNAIPATEGRVANTAKGGAVSAELLVEATSALAQVPAPLLAIIQTVDNDQQCDNSTVAKLGMNLQKALELIHSASPNTKMVVVGQLGRPTVEFITALADSSPSARATLQWNDACAPIDADGNVSESGIANLVRSSDAYEAESIRVCALVENCFTDGGLRKAWVDTLDQFGSDFNHFGIAGQAREAEELWPLIEDILSL